jgi:NAD/NADP transhydrogenase beta subunit
LSGCRRPPAIENELFRDNTMMLYGDAKKMCDEVVTGFA